MRKSLVFLLVALAVAGSLTACKGNTEAPEETTEIAEETTEDPFSLGGVPINVTPVKKETEPAKEVEVVETYADGTYTALLENGDTRTTMNGTDLRHWDRLTETEIVNLDAIVSSWETNSTLPVEYLQRNISKEAFTSLTDKEREEIIGEIAERTPHAEEETLAEQEVPINLDASPEEQKRLEEEYNSLTEEEKDQLEYELTGGKAVHADGINTEALEGLSMSGAQ